MKEKMKNQCTLERKGEKFIVEVLEEGKGATVTDQFGVVITIKYGSVVIFTLDYPMVGGTGKTRCLKLLTALFSLFSKYKGQLKEEESYKQMQDYVKNCK